MTVTLGPVGRERLRSALAAHGAAPLKRHGQHFLLDNNLLAAIVRDGGVVPGQVVIEVGPGPGLLTRHLLAAGAHVLAIEIDPLMKAVAQDLVEPELMGRLEWHEADALAGGRRLGAELRACLPRAVALVSNLPYSIAGPLLGALAVEPEAPAEQVVMIQREMGDRLTARPGQPDYGPLAVIMALCADVDILRRVGPQAFWPAPKVDSVVVSIRLRRDRPAPGGLQALQEFIAAAFHNRRKTLWNSLDQALGEGPRHRLEGLGLTELEKRSRAESLDAVQLYDLAQRWAHQTPAS